MELKQLEAKLQSILPDSRLLSTALNLCPEICLYLLEESYPQHLLTKEQVDYLMDHPPYWSFCWASGDVLARYILDNPEVVQGKTVLDFGAGSSVAGIAAAMAGAKRVIACDLDADALAISQCNAQLNKVELQLISDLHHAPTVDLILAADVLYDRENMPLLALLESKSSSILLADSRVPEFNRLGYQMLGQYESCTWPDLDESASFRYVRLFSYQKPQYLSN